MPLATMPLHGDALSAPSRPPRFLLYSHDGSGLGHVRRNLNLASAIVENCSSASVLVATGSETLDAFAVPPSVDVLRLPGIRKIDNARYSARRLAVADDDVRALRAALLRSAVQAFRPDVLLADKHPAGVRNELVPALEALRKSGGRAALGLRDVLDGAVESRRSWRHGAAEAVLHYHDMVLVYGEQGLLDPLAGSGLEGRAGIDIRYCGYVVAGPTVAADESLAGRRAGRPLVLGCAGGGEDGTPVLSSLLTAARDAPWDVVAVTGPHAERGDRPGLDSLARAADAEIVTSVPEMGAQLGAADAVVCMGGYNSLVEALAAAVPTVCVPRVVPRTEQLRRATAFEERGLLRTLTPDSLSPGRLRAEVDAALQTDRGVLAERIAATVCLDGRHLAATTLLGLAGARSSATAARVS